MPNITLQKAMKIKNRLANRLSRASEQIRQGNSVVQGQKQPAIRALWDQRQRLVAMLVVLKARIEAASNRVRPIFLDMQEKRSTIQFLQELPTLDGETGQVHYGTNEKIIRVAEIKENEVEKWVEDLEAQIDAAQDQIDEYNFKTTIEVDSDLLEAAGSKPARR